MTTKAEQWLGVRKDGGEGYVPAEKTATSWLQDLDARGHIPGKYQTTDYFNFF